MVIVESNTFVQMIIDGQPGFCGGQISNQMFVCCLIDLFLHLVEQCSRILQKYLKHFKKILKIILKILSMKYLKK